MVHGNDDHFLEPPPAVHSKVLFNFRNRREIKKENVMPNHAGFSLSENTLFCLECVAWIWMKNGFGGALWKRRIDYF